MNEGTVGADVAGISNMAVSNLTPKKEMYIRKCYKEMGTLVVDYLNKRQEAGIPMRVVITGTPQIGKSTFMSYLLGIILSETPFKRIALLTHRYDIDHKG